MIKNYVGFIAPDKCITVNGISVFVDTLNGDEFKFPYEDVHAIHWNGNECTGTIEWKNLTVVEFTDYEKYVQPYVNAHNAKIQENMEEAARNHKELLMSRNPVEYAKSMRKEILIGTDWWTNNDIEGKPEHAYYRYLIRDVIETQWNPHWVWDEETETANLGGIEWPVPPDEPKGIIPSLPESNIEGQK